MAKKRKKAKRKTKRKPARKKKKTAKRKTVRKKTKRKATRKKATKKRKTVRKAKKRKAPKAFMAPLTPSKELAAVIGSKPLPRTQAVKKLWQYIKRKKLQDKKNKRQINTDAKLKPVFGGKKSIDMFQMMKFLKKHLKK